MLSHSSLDNLNFTYIFTILHKATNMFVIERIEAPLKYFQIISHSTC